MNLQKTFLILCCSTWLAACSFGAGAEPTANVGTTILPSVQVEPTQPAAVATVNGEVINSQVFSIHLAQYQAAQAETGALLASENVETIVLEDLISRLLLAQGARAGGFAIDDTTIEERMSALVQQTGGQAALEQWMELQGYTPELFRQELSLEIEAGWMRNEIANGVPLTAEQVNARQILFSDSFSAERVLSQLQGGSPFDNAVQANDPQRLGTLGWFPRGYLLQPQVEEVAFAMQPGEFSGVIETDLGFHIVEVIEHSPDRELSPQARLALQIKALTDWLAAQRTQSAVEIFLP
jgi:parvulin-like peptidyl-prolyl isomerase